MEGTFSIDFFELCFLAEACIPERPIARSMFWDNLTNRYWNEMDESERERMFTWLNRNDIYQESLKKHEQTKIFHARFDPDNQYLVKTKLNDKEEEHRAFKFDELYCTGIRKWIHPDYIVSVEKLKLKV